MIRIFKVTSITLVFLIVSMWALIYFSPAPPLVAGLSYSNAVYDSHQQLLRLTLSSDGKYRLFTPLSAISPTLQAATLLQEDQYFTWHRGVNPISLLKAVWHTYIIGPRRMGASTITMQLAKLRFGINSKKMSGKLQQITRALQIEAHYSKDEILEAYLNLAPYGNNVEGVGAASLIYFGKEASNLSLPEALTLAVIPQNPTKRIPDHKVLQAIRNKLFLRWVALQPKDADKSAIMQLPLQIQSVRKTPFLAPHFVNEVLVNNTSHKVLTTLDYNLQKMVERTAHNYIARKAYVGVNNTAVMIVDTRDMSVKSMLGSVDFFNQAISGQINGTAIKRSPGSTLKPLIYALAMDQGLIHPGTILKDVPRSFGSYNPENFDNDFMGPIKARDALALSRNIPAIYLADQLRNPNLYSFLQAANVQDLKSESFYGLALVLGGAELSMQELVGLYAVLANGGVWRPLRELQSDRQLPGKQLLSPEASFLVLDMLKHTDGVDVPATAWKTGTSSGYRDAWTIGLVGPYVLAVWVGNFNNQGNPEFIGKQVAAPLFIELANAMNKNFGPFATLYPYPERMHLIKTDVCKASGMLPTRYCHDTEKEWFIPGKSPITTDTIYREIAIDAKTGLRTCHFNAETKFQIAEFWPSDLLRIFHMAGMQRRTPPGYDPSCLLASKVGQGFSPQITNPQNQVSYVTRLDARKPTIIPLAAVVDADVKNVYWFMNETYLGKVTRDKSFLWQASPGHFVVRVVDDFGRSDARDITILNVA